VLLESRTREGRDHWKLLLPLRFDVDSKPSNL